MSALASESLVRSAPAITRVATRFDALDALESEFGGREGFHWTRPDGGMFVWVRLPDGWDADALLQAALEREVAFVPGWPFYAGPPDRATLRLSFTTHTEAEIAEGLGRLGAAVDSRR